MAMELLNGSLKIEIFYDRRDKEYEDNICLSIKETGPDEEKVFYASETNLYVSPEDARRLAEMLRNAADVSSHATR